METTIVTLESRFQGLVNDYKLKLEPDDQENFATTTLQCMKRAISNIQSQKDETGTMMNMNRMAVFLDRIDELEKALLAVNLPEPGRFMAYIWGTVRFLLERTKLTEKAFDNVLDGYELLGAHIMPLSQYTGFFREFTDAEECLLNIYEDIQRFHSLAYELFSLRPKLWQRLHKYIWKDLRNNFKHIAKSLDFHAEFIKKHADDTSYRRSGSGRPSSAIWMTTAAADFHRYRSDLKADRKDFEENEAQRKSTQKCRIKDWILSSPKIQELQRNFKEARICNSGRWLFRSYNEVSQWLDHEETPVSAIWLRASRGFGKSVLASLVVDELEELRKEDRGFRVPPKSKTYFFYCQEDDAENRTFLGILNGILSQMVEQDDYVLPLCDDKRINGGGDTLANVQTTQNLIEAFAEYNERQYIIIDGLNECEDTEIRQTAGFFMELVAKHDKQSQGKLRVMFLSQPLPDMKKYLPEDKACITLKSTDNAEDIRTFVKKRLLKFSQSDGTHAHFNLSQPDKDQIESAICRQSGEMFLYADLAIKYLLEQPNKAALLDKIRQEILPKGLKEMYESLLDSIKSQLMRRAGGESHWQYAKLFLGWLVCAKRPLKLHEMQAILSFDPETLEVDFDYRMLRQNMRTYLGSLVHFMGSGDIRLIHATARKYLARNRHIQELEVECHLATLCLKYLCVRCFTKAYDADQRQQDAKLGYFAFQDYACSHWQSHIDTVIRKCSDKIATGSLPEAELAELSSALEVFINTHDEVKATKLRPDLDRSHTDMLEGLPFSQNLLILWNHIYTFQRGTYEDLNKVGVAQIDKALRDNRAILQTYSPKDLAQGEDTMADYYGPNMFKCQRARCRFFHIGYDNEKDLKTHHNRHDRPFRCPVPLCKSGPIGFSTNKDKDRHEGWLGREMVFDGDYE
ncbi:hypothetical protein ACJZ2D_010522 [Fusarium nematophilum]